MFKHSLAMLVQYSLPHMANLFDSNNSLCRHEKKQRGQTSVCPLFLALLCVVQKQSISFFHFFIFVSKSGIQAGAALF